LEEVYAIFKSLAENAAVKLGILGVIKNLKK
jgi:hypothetical protein